MDVPSIQPDAELAKPSPESRAPRNSAPLQKRIAYAHSLPDRLQEEWQPLEDHLRNVAKMAAEFAAAFGSEDWGFLAGLWHDLGKYSPDFQTYLDKVASGEQAEITPHAIWGAALAYHLYWQRGGDPEAWKELSLPIHGHHSGLQDDGILALRIERFLETHCGALGILRDALSGLPKPPPMPGNKKDVALSREMAIRMVFSATVDADFLDTEAFYDKPKAKIRGCSGDIASLWTAFQLKQDEFAATVKDAGSGVNRIRQAVLDSCLRSAALSPGIFRLTVPTGGGKTRSALAFALKHAADNPRQGFRRVIVAIPYTSIIEQTAGVYRDILGDEAVLEHHSQVDAADREGQTPATCRKRLACENWDAPLIVTTTVQLFESLFADKPGKTRKLHNIARSILVLDEVQSLPPALLRPTLSVLRALADEYGVTVVLSTATQPTFEDAEFLNEFRGVRVQEIVPDFARHFAELQRVTYEIKEGKVSWDEVAAAIRTDKAEVPPQSMVVLNSRKDALALLDALSGVEDVFHLSTLLCGAHRAAVLNEVRKRLDPANAQPVRLIATQVVEAGVDLDFPTVWRAMGPLDRIVQAAGRCNREGRRSREESRVVIFEPAEGRTPRGAYRLGIEKAHHLLQGQEGSVLHDPSLYRRYFRLLYNDVDHSLGREIQQHRAGLDFPKVAELFKLISEDTVHVVVNYRDGFKRLEAWKVFPSRETWQRLQPYLVSVYSREAVGLQADGWLELVSDGLYRWIGKYDEIRGIRAEYDPSDLIQ